MAAIQPDTIPGLAPAVLPEPRILDPTTIRQLAEAGQGVLFGVRETTGGLELYAQPTEPTSPGTLPVTLSFPRLGAGFSRR
jgi:hypothetical protein